MDFNSFIEKAKELAKKAADKADEAVDKVRFAELLRELYRDNELTDSEKQFAMGEAAKWGMTEQEALEMIAKAEDKRNK